MAVDAIVHDDSLRLSFHVSLSNFLFSRHLIMAPSSHTHFFFLGPLPRTYDVHTCMHIVLRPTILYFYQSTRFVLMADIELIPNALLLACSRSTISLERSSKPAIYLPPAHVVDKRHAAFEVTGINRPP